MPACQGPMRILLATDSYPPLIGGATRAAQLLGHELVRRGHDVHVVTVAQEGAAPEEDDQGVSVTRLHAATFRMGRFSSDPYRRVPPPFPDPELTARLRRVIAATSPDVVHAYGWLAYSCAVALAGRSTPLLLSARDYGNICAVRTLMRRDSRCSGPGPRKCLACAAAFYGPVKGAAAAAGVLAGRRLLRRRISGIHSVSGFVDEAMRRHLVDGRKDLHRAVIPDFRVESGEAAGSVGLPSEPYILYVGALRRVKGIHVLIDAWQALRRPRPPLVLIGPRAPDTPDAFPAGVTVIEDAPHAVVMRAWRDALLGVAPSVWYEPLGNVVHEAQSRGAVVIGTTPGGHDDMITSGEDGLLVPPGDRAALRDAMQVLVDDPALREAMGERGRARAARFTAERIVPEFEALYRDVLRCDESAEDAISPRSNRETTPT